MTDYRTRLINFYQKYQPDKLSQVDDLLSKSSGKEEKLFAKLVEKYGPEPAESELKKQTEVATTVAVTAAKKADVVVTIAPKREQEEKKKNTVEGKKEKVEYGSREWWKARIVRFYKKYAPEKEGDVDKLLEKSGNEPKKLEKLIAMLEEKYGEEPDASSDEDDDDDGGGESEQEEQVKEEEEEEEEEESFDKPRKKKQQPAKPVPPSEPELPPTLKKIVYCPIDGVPPEYSEYFETFPAAVPWLAANFPNLKLALHKDVTVAEYALEKGIEKLDLNSAASASVVGERKRGKKKGDGKIYVEVLERRKKKFTTSVKGLEQVEDLKLKDAAKLLGKKFASGASVQDLNGGDEFIEIQGDVADELPAVLLEFFKTIKKEQIYRVTEDGKKPAF